MQGKRLDRVSHLIQMELSELILHRVKDPRLGFVTVTHVDVASDVKSAVVYVSVMGDEKARRASVETLEKAAGFLQREIGHHLELRYTPKLVFRLDRSVDINLQIEQLMKKERPDDDAQAPPPSA